MKTIWILIGIFYAVSFIPAFRTAVSFWLFRDKDHIANQSMKHGFIFGFLSIWFIYPIYIIKSCFGK